MEPHRRVVVIAMWCLILCAMLGLMPSGLSVSVVHFPDPNLEAAVRGALGKPTGDVTDEDVAGLTSLAARYRDIRDLTGLEYATDVQA